MFIYFFIACVTRSELESGSGFSGRVGFGSGSGSDSDLESGSGRVRVRTLCVIFFNSMI